MEILESIDRDRIAALRAADEFFWLDVLAPSAEQVLELGELFALHPLALEDTEEFGQRPKLDEYEDQVLLVFYGVHHDEHGESEPELVEVHLHISGSWLLTVHRRPCRHLHDARRFAQQGRLRSEEYAVYKVLDALTDSFFPVLERLDDRIDQLEDAMAEMASRSDRQEIFALKRELVGMRQRVNPQRDLLASGGELIHRLPGFSGDEAHDYFRDVYDHLLRISEQIDSYREMLSGTLEVYLSTESNRLSEVGTRLTIVATVFLPLTVVTGFFGQNFAWLTSRIDTLWAFLVFGVGGMLVPLVILFVLLRRAGYLGARGTGSQRAS
jgi:magnesium transporter